MEPPNEEVFETREQLIASIQQHALSHGYAITTISSNLSRNTTFGCDRGGVYCDRINAPDGAKRRKTSTKRIGCPFRLYAKKLNSGQWEIQVRNSTHNHEADDNMIGHSIARRRQLTKDQNQTIQSLSDIGSKPQHILGLIRKDPTVLITPRDIYNIQTDLRRKKLGNYTPLEFLRETLQQKNWRYKFKQDSDGHILFFIFAHPESIRLANQYNRVFLLDCTYKTNRYKMPLLHIIGLSPSNLSFSIAFCFMQNEQEESYKWTLQTFFSWLNPLPFPPVLCTDRDLALLGAIKVIYPKSPHLLCVWHINKNVLAKTKQYFSSNDEFEAFIQSWKSLINSSSTFEYQDQLAKFETNFSQIAPAALRYIKNTWLTYKEMFIRAWVGQYLHFGNWATSRVEGSHAILKKYIGGSTGDILFVFERINNALEAQHYNLSSDLAEDRIKTLNFCSHFLYSNITKRTSRYSISLISNQASIAKRATPEAPLSNCTNIFTRTMGLPCAHRIASLLSTHQPIPLSDIHQFWRIDYDNEASEYLPILEPILSLPQRKQNQDNTSDQRVIKKKAPSKCSNCGEIGHTIRSCRV
jgi:hypothetical protein